MDAIQWIIAFYLAAWALMFLRTFPASMRTIKEVAPNSMVYKYRVIGGIAYALMLFVACLPLFRILIDDNAKERFIISFTAGGLGDKNA